MFKEKTDVCGYGSPTVQRNLHCRFLQYNKDNVKTNLKIEIKLKSKGFFIQLIDYLLSLVALLSFWRIKALKLLSITYGNLALAAPVMDTHTHEHKTRMYHMLG